MTKKILGYLLLGISMLGAVVGWLFFMDKISLFALEHNNVRWWLPAISVLCSLGILGGLVNLFSGDKKTSVQVFLGFTAFLLFLGSLVFRDPYLITGCLLSVMLFIITLFIGDWLYYVKVDYPPNYDYL